MAAFQTEWIVLFGPPKDTKDVNTCQSSFDYIESMMFQLWIELAFKKNQPKKILKNVFVLHMSFGNLEVVVAKKICVHSRLAAQYVPTHCQKWKRKYMS